MARRKNQVFNLSFLDLVTGALGAVIFLFIITPKGGSSAPDVNQTVVYIDTAEMKIFGDLHDSLQTKKVGDTLFTVLVDYKNFPKPEKRKVEEKKIDFNQPVSQPVIKTRQEPKTEKPVEKPIEKTEDKTIVTETQETVAFKGDAPSVPCKVSFEINWKDQADNVDFFVCKDGDCVYGGRKRDFAIGQWDSGKSRNRLFGNDLRTTQEAVRQFDEIIPGEYMLYARFKESESNRTSVMLKGLIYTKDKNNQQRGETFTKTISLSENRVLLGKIILKADGTYQFIQR